MELILEHVTKSFKKQTILKDINYTFKHGFIYGLLGKNGAGKTTLFHSIASNYKDQLGSIYLKKGNQKELLNSSHLGYVLAEPMIPEFLTGYEFIKFFMEIQKIEEQEKIYDYFKMVHITKEDSHKLIKEYSLGMKNKIQILIYLDRKSVV